MRTSDKLKFSFGKNLPLILQTDPAESGLACLAMLASYYHGEIDYALVRQIYPISRRGMSLEKLTETAWEFKLSAKVIEINFKTLRQVTLPCILQWDFNQFVVLKKISGDRIVIHNPQGEVESLTIAEAGRHFQGIAIEISPHIEFSPSTADHNEHQTKNEKLFPQRSESHEKNQKKKFSWRKLIGSTSGIKRSLIQICALAFALEILQLLLPLVTQLTFDHVIVTADTNLLIVLIFGMAFLELARMLINTLRAWSVMILSATLNVQWISNVFSHLIRLPTSWFERRHIGDVTSRFEAIHPIQGMVTTRSIEVGLDGVMSLITLIVLFVYNANLAFIVVATVILYFMIRLLWLKVERRATEENVIIAAQQQSIFLETLRSINTIRIFNGIETRKNRWINRLIAERNTSLRMQRLSILMESTSWTLFGVERVAVLGLGALAVINEYWSVGMFLAFYDYRAQFVDRTIGVINKIIEFKLLGIQVERLSDIVLEPTEKEYPSTVDSKNLPATFTVNNIDFRYDESQPFILKNCSLNVNSGESIAIVGSSGSGKSTLLKIMIGAHEPTAGEILFGGINLQSVGTKAYRDLIGVTLQDDQLLSGSIAENIAFFSAKPDYDHIVNCAKIAAIHDEISSMSLGYHTLLGDMGTWLSGGQKQRILLARALYKNPKILFLDEATSHLDIANEALVNESIKRLGITTIFIAHRPETIRMADRVILIEGGKAEEIDINILEKLKQRKLEIDGLAL